MCHESHSCHESCPLWLQVETPKVRTFILPKSCPYTIPYSVSIIPPEPLRCPRNPNFEKPPICFVCALHVSAWRFFMHLESSRLKLEALMKRPRFILRASAHGHIWFGLNLELYGWDAFLQTNMKLRQALLASLGGWGVPPSAFVRRWQACSSLASQACHACECTRGLCIVLPARQVSFHLYG